MNFLSFQPKTRLLIIFLGLLLGLTFLVIIITSIFRTPPAPEETLPPKTGVPLQIENNKDPKQEPTFTNYLQTIIGVTTDEEITKFKDLIKKEDLGDGRTAYYFPSSDPQQDNVIETKDGKAIFKRVTSITSDDYQVGRFAPYREQYGQPDSEQTGTARYDSTYKTYIYASRGFAFIVNPYTDGVYEIQSFIPVTVDEYLAHWGEDIRKSKEEQLRRSTQQDFNEGALE